VPEKKSFYKLSQEHILDNKELAEWLRQLEEKLSKK
jgi:hypothetical protein